MKQYIDAIRRCIDSENWYAALFLSLSLPGICAKLEDNTTKESAKEKYITWFNKYLGNEYNKRLKPEFFWELHSSMLLPGKSPDSKASAKFLPVTYHDSPLHNSDITLASNECYAHLRVDIFCEDVCSAVEKWMADSEHNNEIQDRLKTLFLLESFADDPRAYKIVLGEIKLTWGKHIIKNLCVNVPKGFDSRKN